MYFLQVRGEGHIQILQQIGGPSLSRVGESGLDEGAEEEGAEREVCDAACFAVGVEEVDGASG